MNIPDDDYILVPSDLDPGVDQTNPPYPDDGVVLDPPYIEGLFRRTAGQMAGAGSHAVFRNAYSNSQATHDGAKLQTRLSPTCSSAAGPRSGASYDRAAS